MDDSNAHSLINQLLHGRDIARRLQLSLNDPSTSPQTPHMFILDIISTFDNALSLLNAAAAAPPLPESPPITPRSPDSQKQFQPQQHQNTSARWTKHIRIGPGMAVESLLDDGFSWRKYGQKDILGAKFPRGYYRCTHRHAQGCLATKQVQRSDQDPTIMEVNYRGNHTCKLPSTSVPPSQDQLVNLRAGLRVLTDNLNASDRTSFASFLLPSTSNVRPDSLENNVVENSSSTPHESPATSETAHFSNSFGGPLNLPPSTSHINNPISPASDPAVAPQFPFDHFEFEGPNFTFHDPRYF